MNLEEVILQNGFYVIGKNSSHLGVDYSILACTKPQIDIYNGCQYAAFTEVGECIAIGSESGGPGMDSHGGWSGNESIIIAMEQNICMWNGVWVQS